MLELSPREKKQLRVEKITINKQAKMQKTPFDQTKSII